jgi:hypothetical protein
VRRTTLTAAALIPCCVLALSACGSKSANSSASGGASAAVVVQNNAHLTQAQLLARFKAALADATALHMKGSMTDKTGTTSMDLQLNKDGSGQGTMTMDGAPMKMIAVGDTMYTQITPGYVNMIKSGMGADSGSATVEKLLKEFPTGKWMKTSMSGDGSDGSSSTDGMLSFSDMIKQLGDGSTDKFSYLDTSTLDGQQVAQYKDVSTDGSDPTATMDIPLTGSPLPIMEDAGSGGAMTFTWNQPTKVTAPPAADVVSMDSIMGGLSATSPTS